jgi:dTDP-4-amino-4,6-dideoxygalactose transaminase
LRIGRTLPPTAPPIGAGSIWHGLRGLVAPRAALRRLDAELREWFGGRDVFLVSSGTAALTVALRALRTLTGRSEVVIPAYTCFSVPAAVIHAGLRPVLCDVDETGFDLDPAALERAIGPRTVCVVVQHLFGIPSNVARVRRLCEPRGIFVVEDAAQALGVDAGGRPAGTIGDIGIFSLGRGKQITSGGGGILVTGSATIARAIAREWDGIETPSPLRTALNLLTVVAMAILMRPRLYWIPAALPFLRLGETLYPRRIPIARLSGMQAGLLRQWQAALEKSNRDRALAAANLARTLAVSLPDGAALPYLRLPVFVASAAERDRVVAASRVRGLGVSPAYPAPVNEIPEISHLFEGQRFPAARRVADRLLTLPTHRWVSESDRNRIAATFASQAAGARPSASMAYGLQR